jgi:hypothetical protein
MKDFAPKAGRSLVVLGATDPSAGAGNDFGKLSFGVLIQI